MTPERTGASPRRDLDSPTDAHGLGSHDPAAGGHERLFRSTGLVAALTFLSRLTGLARDIAFSSWFGSGPVMDAFAVAFKVPNLLRRFFGEGAFSQAFVPVISEYRATRSPAETKNLIDRAAGTLAVVLAAITVVGVVAAPVVILVFAPGFLDDQGRYQLAVRMLRLTFPYVLFVSLTALAGSILNAHRRFAVPAFTPLLLNVVIIGFAGWVEPRLPWPGVGLASGVFVAGLVQLSFQLPFLKRLGVLPRPRWDLAHEGVRRIMRLALPAMFGSSIAQFSILADTLIASFLVAGSISWLYYTERLIEFPLGVFGVALGTVILPRLSEQHATASPERFSATLDWALRLVVLIACPAAIALCVLAAPVLTALFHGGEFGARDVSMAAASLRTYAPGIVGFMLVRVLAPGYFARQDTRTPVRVGVQALSLGMALKVLFVLVLAGTSVVPAHAGITAATACAGLFNAGLLLRGLLKSGAYRPRAGWREIALVAAGANALMAVVLIVALHALGDWLPLGKLAQLERLGLLVAGGAAVYIGVCWLLGLRPRDLRASAA